jgi:hypothetical protein
MCSCLRFASIASLLIGLQLFSPKIVAPKLAIIQSNNTSSHQSFVASNSNNSQAIPLLANFGDDFEPPDNGGPDYTRGSGTR